MASPNNKSSGEARMNQTTPDTTAYVIRRPCPGCGRILPFTTEFFGHCPLCGGFYCLEHCIRTCVICGRQRCHICMEHIEKTRGTSGRICEKCAALIHGTRARQMAAGQTVPGK